MSFICSRARTTRGNEKWLKIDVLENSQLFANCCEFVQMGHQCISVSLSFVVEGLNFGRVRDLKF